MVSKVGSRLPDGTQITKWMRDENGYSNVGISEVANEERVNHPKDFMDTQHFRLKNEVQKRRRSG